MTKLPHHLIADYIAAACTLTAVILSFSQIYKHFYYNEAKRMRNYCVRILVCTYDLIRLILFE